MNHSVCIAEQARNCRPVVEIDDRRLGAAGTDAVRLGFVADKRRHVVAVFLKFHEYVRSDESDCTGECDVHGFLLRFRES